MVVNEKRSRLGGEKVEETKERVTAGLIYSYKRREGLRRMTRKESASSRHSNGDETCLDEEGRVG